MNPASSTEGMPANAGRFMQKVTAAYNQSPFKGDLERVRTYCMFLGYPRSGHSIVGSLLDAHPNMVIAHELDALKYIQAGFNKEQIFYLLLVNSQRFTKAGRNWNGYQYVVPNQWHGRYRELHVIGDKKGGGSSRLLYKASDLIDRLRQVIGIKIKFIHVTRNPYDNIATISKRHHLRIPDAIEFYFDLAQTVRAAKQQIATEDFFEMRHEDLLVNPKELTRRLCLFLGEEAPEDYLSDCASIVRPSPHKSRLEAAWTDEMKKRVQKTLEQFPFFAGYTFEN